MSRQSTYSRSCSTKLRNVAVCSGVQTMTGEGFSPVSFQRAMRSSLQTRVFGFVPGSNSTCAAGVKARITCWAMATFSAARRVSRMCGWGEAGDSPKRNRLRRPSCAGSSSWEAAQVPCRREDLSLGKAAPISLWH